MSDMVEKKHEETQIEAGNEPEMDRANGEETVDEVKDRKEGEEEEEEEEDEDLIDEDEEDEIEEDGKLKENEQTINIDELSRTAEEKARQFLARQTKPVIIPSFAAWFTLNDIHEIEKRSLPEFFTSQSRFKTEAVYRDYRDFMVNTYRLNPIEYLTVTACRRNLAGDVASIIRVHAFLEQWGIINYQIDPRTKPTLTGPQYTGHFQVSLDTPTGIQPFIPLDTKLKIVDKEKDLIVKPVNEEKNQLKKTLDDDEIRKLEIPLNLEVRKDIFDSSEDAILLKEKERVLKSQQNSLENKVYLCHICGTDSTEIRYHNLRSKTAICPNCFESGHFPSNFHSLDFIRLINQRKLMNESWTEQEILLLLEGIEMFEDDWDKIAKHLGTRNKKQCISKFLQLPIEDRYLNKSISRNSFKKENSIYASDDHSNAYANKETFAVLSTVKFLLSKIDPDLAKNTTKYLQNELLNKNINQKDETVEDSKVDSAILEAAKKSFGVLGSNAVFEQLKELQNQQKLLNKINNLQLKKVDLKLKTLNQYEKLLENDKMAIEEEKKRVLLDRIALRSQALSVKDKLTNAIQLISNNNNDTVTNAESIESANKLMSEAAEEIKKPSTIIVIDNNKKDANELAAMQEVDDEAENDNENSVNIINEKLEPISVANTQAYQLWQA